MKIKKILLLFIVSISLMSFIGNVMDDIATAVRSGNPATICKFFIANIDMKLIDKEEVYSKQQAEMILKDFFIKHPVKKYTVAHNWGSNNGSQYAIGTLETAKGKFKTYYAYKASGPKPGVTQFKIENE